MSDRLRISWMIRRDLPEVLEIESLSFDDPWTEDDFQRELRKRTVLGFVAERDGKVLGYVVVSNMPGKIRLVNFAVHPDHRRNGVGSYLVAKVASKLSDRRPTMHVVVHERWLGCQLFLREMGFRARRVLRGEFDGDDGYEMQARAVVPASSGGGR